MLSVEEMQRTANRVTYKPGWSWKFYLGKHEGHHCAITAHVVDGYDPTQTIELRVETFLSPNDVRDEQSLLTWMAYRMKRIEIHELREFMRLDGQVYDDPHADGADQDL